MRRLAVEGVGGPSVSAGRAIAPNMVRAFVRPGPCPLRRSPIGSGSWSTASFCGASDAIALASHRERDVVVFKVLQAPEADEFAGLADQARAVAREEGLLVADVGRAGREARCKA